jgi:type IV pilus assembly protein PilO
MNGFKRMRIVFMALLALFLTADLVLLGYLFWPSSSIPLKDQQQKLQAELTVKRRAAIPLRGIDQKLIDTRADIKQFYAERIPAYDSLISSELHKLETANGVGQANIRYQHEDTELPNVQRVLITTGVVSDYVKIARFINALERDPLLFVIKEITVTGQPAGTVQLQIRLETFLFLKGASG